ncbi:GVIN1 GTPase, partial [Amia calva]|nr:GVIN1 GTPase [Amia calva]
MVEVENNISSEITAILESCKKSLTDWGTVEEELKSVYQKCEPVKECLESSLSHNNLENEQKHQFVPVPATDSLGEGEKLTKPIKTGEGTGTKVRKTVERLTGPTPLIRTRFETIRSQTFKNLLVRLGLLKYYPQKLRKTDILVIDKLSLQMNHPITEEELPFHYLYKLMMLDYRARTVVWKEDRKTTHVEEQGPSAGAGDVDSEDEDFFSNETRQTCEETEDQLTHIHPMDIHMAVFHCADDFLRQYLLLKYTTCQYALPLLIPQPCSDTIEFPLWALRQVKKTWGCKDLSEKDGFIKCKNSHVFNTSVPTVSFLRLGNCSASKSQILNSVISKQKHNIFFHRHCRGSTAHCLLMDGVVEIAWYCPGGKEDDIFDNCLSFTNLHGDASQLPAQVEFLQEVSAVSVVLISGSLNEAARKTSEALLKSPAPVIFLFDDNSIVSRGKNPNKVKLAVRNKNEAELVDRIISNIKCFVTEQSNTSSLSEFLSTARRLRFDIDENNEKCMEGNAIASAVLRWIKEENLTAVKERLLPLQGKLWYDWCTKNKEQYRLKGNASKSIEQQLCEIKKEKKVIRSEQLKKAFPLNGLMRSFLECLGSSSLSRDTKMFMLQWLRTYLDDLTTETLLKLEEKYHTQWTGMRKNKNTIKRGVEFRLQKELDLISEELNAATLGIQHFFREMGQIYEAQLDNRERTPKTQDYVHCLPDIGAEMLISGYPLELMDGDAAHVPLEWIGAVLDKLIEKNGNKRVFVLSVLGIQSSGKSTLLNTMFGLQFTVSAGRCTRGAFMQLVRVDEEVREQLQYDYVLIVDTEGLRSPELSNKSLLSHDNELATFIIGIGDMTLINIMGENPSEMQDILQICVQAFMRMKRVKLNPSCIFVHQNVAETSAGEKNMEGRRRLQERLDEMTQIAAKEEHCDVAAFSDIIHFDVESQVFYFKNLLEGDPPMAPPNPSYSQNVQELKTKMLSIAKWRPNCRFSTLTEFKSRTEDLWNSLLGENFVFSFKNTLEMVVYSNLEKAYGTWTWQLRKCAIEVQNRLRNQIMNNIIQDIRALNHMQAFDETYRKITTEIEKYFSEEKHSGLLIQWRANTEKRLEMVKHDLTMETHDMCVELIRFKKSQFELDQKKSKYEAQLLTRSKALATELKGKASNKMDIKKAFQKLWVEWSDEISALHVPKNEEDIEAVVDTILLDCFKKHVDLIAKVMKKSERFLFNEKTHISKQSKIVLLTQRFTYKDRVSVDELTEDITQTVNTYIERKKEEKLDFSQSYIYGMLDEIKEHIDEFGQSVKHFRITDDYRVELSIYLCRSSMEKFKDMRKAFRKANDPLAYLFSKRSEYVKMFESFCQGITSTTFFADFLCTKLKPAIQQAVYDKASIRITEEMRSNYPAFSGNRSNLENHILRHLAEVGNFNSYMEYINHPKRYFVRFIRQHVAKYCKRGDSLVRLLKESLESLIKTVCSTSNEVTAVVQVNQGNASMWLNKFCADIGGHIVLSRDDLRSIEAEDISDLHFFKNTMQENLAVMAHELKEGFKDKTTDRSQFRKKPDDILTQQLSGCWEQCPFCKAICTNTIPGHDTDHSIQFHRPMALARWYYHNTEHICIEFCTTSVSSDRSFYPHHGDVRTVPWKKYKEAGPPYSTWSITPDHSEKLYWKWIICTWQEEMEKKTGKKFTGPGEIPESWKTITKQAVLQELQ